MKTDTYYIVQTWSDLFVQKTDELGYVQCYGRGKAAHLTLSQARRVYNAYKKRSDKYTPRRFPRIIKVTTEYKTITNN